MSADFDLQSAPEQDGLQWVQASPKDKNGQLKSVRVGFAADGQLSALDILDSFGQRSLIRFSQAADPGVLASLDFRVQGASGRRRAQAVSRAAARGNLSGRSQAAVRSL